MSKTEFCSGWSCLYLTPAPRWVVDVEVLLLWWSCGWFTCPAPPGDLVGLDSVLWWVSRLNSSGCSCVLVFLCSYVLTSGTCRWLNQMARVWLGKAFICPTIASLIDSLAWSSWWLSLAVYVLVDMHTALWAACLVTGWNLVHLVDQLGWSW